MKACIAENDTKIEEMKVAEKQLQDFEAEAQKKMK